MTKYKSFKMHRLLEFSILSCILVCLTLVVVIKTNASYQVFRPITNGQINQTYLYAEELSGGSQHKGVDISANNGTNVYSIADGKVMDLEERYQDYDHTEGGFGNFVLIKHLARHYVRQNNGQTIAQWGYVYSIYAHLKYNSVSVNINDQVNADQQIAQVDSTGNSTGDHLHLQVIVDPSPDQNDGNNYPWTEITSRNPELWLTTYNGNTARAIGKLTDANGNPLSNVIICGMVKPYGGYGFSRTYSYTWANPDDIFVENFGTF